MNFLILQLTSILPPSVGRRLQELLGGGGLKAKAMRGSVWTIVGFGSGQVLRLGSSLSLTRLLVPEAFGLMALVGVFMQGLAMFSDVGTGPAIMQNKRGDDPEFLDTAWTIQACRGVILALGACLIAYPAAAFYEEPMLQWLLPVSGISAFVAGLNPTKLISANRHLALGRLTVIELATQVITIIALIVLAWTTRSVWSLVLGGIVGSIANLMLLRTYLPGQLNRFRWDASAAKQLVRFGRWIFLATAISFVGQQFDRLFLGRAMSTTELGVYSIGLIFAGAAITCNMQLIRRIGLATLTHTYREKPGDVANRYDKIRKISDSVFMPGLGVLTVIAPLVIQLLYDRRYWSAGGILQILAIAAVVPCILEPAETCLVAIGKPRWGTARYALRTMTCVFCIPLAWHLGGLQAVLYVLAVCEIPGLILLWIGLTQNGIFRLTREIRAVVLYVAAAAATWAILNSSAILFA